VYLVSVPVRITLCSPTYRKAISFYFFTEKRGEDLQSKSTKCYIHYIYCPTLSPYTVTTFSLPWSSFFARFATIFISLLCAQITDGSGTKDLNKKYLRITVPKGRGDRHSLIAIPVLRNFLQVEATQSWLAIDSQSRWMTGCLCSSDYSLLNNALCLEGRQVDSKRHGGCYLFSSPNVQVLTAKFHLNHRFPYTCYPFVRGLLIALMMEAARTSETSVHFNVTTRPYISEV
jgi:hypothetical protein